MEESRRLTERTIKSGEGIALIFGSVGTGKTLLLQRIHQSLESEYTAVFVSNCRLESSKALFCQLSHDLYVTPFASEIIELRLQILDFARQEPTKGVVLIFDDAQHLSLEVLEEIRLLTDSIRGSVPLFRAVLAGTMEFEEKLTQPSLEAFNQRIASRCYLEPLTKEETSQYISRQTDDLRIDPAHETMLPLFSEAVKQQIHRLTDGIPRLINQLCGTVLQFAAEKEQEHIGEVLIEEAWASLQHIEVSDESESSGSSVQEPVISPEQIEEIVDQKKKTFQYRQFDSVEFGTLTDPEPMTVKTDSVTSAQHIYENEYKPPYPEDDEDFPELDEEPIRNDFSAYRLQIHIPAEDEPVEPEPVTLPTKTGVSHKSKIDLRKLVLDFSQQQKKYRRKHLIRKIQHRLGLFAGLHITAKRDIPLIQEPEMTTETLQEYGAAVLEGRPPFVRKKLHYAYQTTDTAPKKEETYPDPKTGTPIILRWHSENANENGRFGVAYTEFLNQDTIKPGSITAQQPEAKKTTETVHAAGEMVVRTSLHASRANLKTTVPCAVSCQGLDETFEETHRVESTAISLAELFRTNSSALQQTCELPEFKDLDVTIQHQLETVIKRITKAAEKIELAAEVSEQAGRHVSKAATLVETEVKAALPTYVDLFKELSEFQKMVSAELDSVRQNKTEPPKFRTFPRRQVMIERALPTIDVELLLR